MALEYQAQIANLLEQSKQKELTLLQLKTALDSSVPKTDLLALTMQVSNLEI